MRVYEYLNILIFARMTIRNFIMMQNNTEEYNRTSIDILGLKKLKGYCLENDYTLKTFINEAINEKLEREARQKQTCLS